MLVKDIMTKNVITASSDTPIGEAKKIMKEHKLRRLPVVDDDKLVGLAIEDRLERVSHPASAPTVWQVVWLVSRTTLGDVMEKDVVTVDPEATVEQAIALAQSRKVGSLVVVKDDRVVGIATTNDFFYRIANPILGIGEPGTRIVVHKGRGGRAIEEIVACINRLGIGIKVIWAVPFPTSKQEEIIIHLDTEDATEVIKELKTIGYRASIRAR